MKQCPRCGTQVADNIGICPNCDFDFKFLNKQRPKPQSTQQPVPQPSINPNNNKNQQMQSNRPRLRPTITQSTPNEPVSDNSNEIKTANSFKDWFIGSLKRPSEVVAAPFNYGLRAYLLRLLVMAIGLILMFGTMLANLESLAGSWGSLIGQTLMVSGAISGIFLICIIIISIFGLGILKISRLIVYKDQKPYSMLAQYMHYVNIQTVMYLLLLIIGKIPVLNYFTTYLLIAIISVSAYGTIMTLSNQYNSKGYKRSDGLYGYLLYSVIQGFFLMLFGFLLTIISAALLTGMLTSTLGSNHTNNNLFNNTYSQVYGKDNSDNDDNQSSSDQYHYGDNSDWSTESDAHGGS